PSPRRHVRTSDRRCGRSASVMPPPVCGWTTSPPQKAEQGETAMARIAVGGFHHETNTFVRPPTDFAYFCSHRDRPPLVRRGDVLKHLSGISFALSGFMERMSADHELVPLLWTSGGAGGMVTRDAFERIAAELIAELSQQMPVDAIYLDLH